MSTVIVYERTSLASGILGYWMIRALVTRPAGMRRVWALLLGVSLAFSLWESAVPDVHDGDAPVGTDARGGTVAREHPSSATPGNDSERSRDDGPSHTMHVDHCGHGHAAGTVMACRLPMLAVLTDAPGYGVTAGLLSVTQDPQTRPPIA